MRTTYYSGQTFRVTRPRQRAPMIKIPKKGHQVGFVLLNIVVIRQKLMQTHHLLRHIVPDTTNGPPPSPKKSASTVVTQSPSPVANSGTSSVTGVASGHVNVRYLYCIVYIVLFNQIYIYYVDNVRRCSGDRSHHYPFCPSCNRSCNCEERPICGEYCDCKHPYRYVITYTLSHTKYTLSQTKYNTLTPSQRTHTNRHSQELADTYSCYNSTACYYFTTHNRTSHKRSRTGRI